MHLAQCPCCRVPCEIRDEDVGRRIKCSECGERLFASHLVGSETISVVCDQCGKTNEFASTSAGLQMECSCGQSVKVPSVLLKPSLRPSSRSHPHRRSPTRNATTISEGNGNEAQTIQSNVAEQVEVNSPSKDSVVETPTVDAASKNDSPDQPTPSSRRTRRADPVSTIMLATVVVFLMVATVMYFRRDASATTEIATKNGAVENTTATDSDSGRSTADAYESKLIDSSENAATESTAMISSEIPDLLASTSLSNVSVRLIDTNENEGKFNDTSLFPIPPAPLYAIPEPTEARPRLGISEERQPYMTLRTGVVDAFDAYEETQQLSQLSEQSQSDADRFAYQQSLGRTLALVKHVHQLASDQQNTEHVNSMRYLLSYLYHQAGHLPESCIMGLAVARWGDVDEPFTKEAALIAMASAQEANEIQWGSSEQLGELAMMREIANVIADRWPKDDQLGSIWMNLGYLYEAFNQPDQAIPLYQKVSRQSDLYAESQIAAGTAIWLITRRNALRDDASLDKQRMRQGKAFLKRGLERLEKSKTPLNQQIVEVRLALAQIAMFEKQHEEAVSWLTIGKDSLVNRIRLPGDSNGKNAKRNDVEIDESTARQIFDLLYFANQQLGRGVAANQLLEQMVEKIDSVEIDLEARLFYTLKRASDRLTAKAVISRNDIDGFAELSDPILVDEERFPTDSLLWLAEIWAQFSERANSPTLIQRCASEAGKIYEIVVSRTDFPNASLSSAQLRQIELLQTAGKTQASLKLIEDLLAKTPNAIALQIAAAKALQERGMQSRKIADVQTAIDGPSGFSPIWGWGKTVQSLFALRWSPSGTDRHAQQLLLSQFHLAQCQIAIAQQISDARDRQSKLSEIDRSLQRMLTTMSKDNPWYEKFESLQAATKKN